MAIHSNPHSQARSPFRFFCLGANAGLSASINFPIGNCRRQWKLLRQDPGLQAVCHTAPRPLVRPAARFHRHHRTRRHLRQPQPKCLALEFLPRLHPARGIDRTDGNTDFAKSTPMVIVFMETSPSIMPMLEHHHGPGSSEPRGRAVVRTIGKSLFTRKGTQPIFRGHHESSHCLRTS